SRQSEKQITPTTETTKEENVQPSSKREKETKVVTKIISDICKQHVQAINQKHLGADDAIPPDFDQKMSDFAEKVSSTIVFMKPSLQKKLHLQRLGDTSANKLELIRELSLEDAVALEESGVRIPD